jgi:hypothetical protein
LVFVFKKRLMKFIVVPTLIMVLLILLFLSISFYFLNFLSISSVVN